jgi:hypothetical protein
MVFGSEARQEGNSRLGTLIVFFAAALSSGLALAESSAKGAGYEAEFAQRKQELIEIYATAAGASGAYYALARLATGRSVDSNSILSSLGPINARRDCADFAIPGLLWILYKYHDSPEVSQAVLDQIRQALLNFKYWPDEPGIDSMCSWTENHEILFMTGAYLAGQFWPTETFTNSGWTGAQQMARHRPRIMKWLDLRFRTGFWEWLSNVYYAEDILALMGLAELCEDEEIALRATMVMDTLCLDLASNSFQGILGSTHGRSYGPHQKWAHRDSTSPVQWLLFGKGYMNDSSDAATLLALSEKYRMPEVIYTVANDQVSMQNHQRMGIRVEDGSRWGLGYDNFEDGMVWLSTGAYAHPLTVELFVEMLSGFNWWQNSFFSFFESNRDLVEQLYDEGTLASFTESIKYDATRVMYEEVNILTYRTPVYMLSSAPDYRPGYGGGQQYIWQATLGPDAVCFTTHPGSYTGDEPGYWVGNGWLPRVYQDKNVAIVIYNAVDRYGIYLPESLDFTHAWLPKDKFEEIVELNGWVFAHLGRAYLALYSQNPYSWQTNPGEDQHREMIVPGRQNIYICELGREATHGTFNDFINAVSQADLVIDGLSVEYNSPSRGHIAFEWASEFDTKSQSKIGDPFPRYYNPYVYASFPSDSITVHDGESRLVLDWNTPSRDIEQMPPTQMPVTSVVSLSAAVALFLCAGLRGLRLC